MIIRTRARRRPIAVAEDQGGPSQPAADGPAGDDDRDVMRAERMLALVAQARASALGNVLGATFLIAALWHTSPPLSMAGWGVMMCLVAGLRARLLAPWEGRNADAIPDREVRYAMRRAALWIVAAGALWGWAAILVPVHAIPIFAAIAASVAAVQATALMVQPAIATGYVLPALLPLSLRFAAVGDRESAVLAVLVLLYAALLVAVARGGHAGFVATIASRRRSEKLASDLASAQALVETTLENVDQGILMIDADRRVPVCNLRAIELFDLPADLMTGRPAFEDVLRWQWTNREFDNAPEALRRFMAAGGISLERPVYEHHRANGTVLEIRSIPLPGGGAVHTYSDVTAQRAREAALRNAEAEYRSLFENAVVGVFRFDLGGRLMRCNTALARMAGYASEAALVAGLGGRTISSEWFQEPARWEEFRQVMRRDGRVTDFVCPVRRPKDGVMLWVSLNGWLVHNERGELVYLEGTALDVTERRRAEEALSRAVAAEEASRVKSEFLANMSHELRTPLNAIIGFSEMLEQQAFGPLGDARNNEYIGDILHSGRHLLAIVNDILDLAKIEAGHMELRFEEVDPIDIAESCKRLVAAQAEAAEVTLALDVDDAPLLRADPKRIRQVLLNLLSNAVKFTPAGGTVSLTIREEGAQRGGPSMAVITVADTGIGMSEDEVKIALQPFGQVDSSRARRHEGTGLGLPLARRLVELHDGAFDIASVPGEGTTATLRLPALAGAEVELAPARAAE
jgi:PAS domain S-box-containing protein